MKVIVARFASMNENAGDVTPFQRPCEKDFRDVTALIMYMCCMRKHICHDSAKKMTLGDVLNPRLRVVGLERLWFIRFPQGVLRR